MEFIHPTFEEPLHSHIAGKLTQKLYIGSGEGEEGRFNSWNVEVYLVHDEHRTLFGLRGTRYSSPDEANEDDEEDEAESSNMLVMVDPLVNDNDWIAWRLMKEYDDLKQPAITFSNGTNEVDLDRGERLNLRHGLPR